MRRAGTWVRTRSGFRRRVTGVWASPHHMTEEQLTQLGEMFDYTWTLGVHIAPALSARLADCPADPARLRQLAEDLTAACQGCVLIQPGGSPALHAILGQMGVPMLFAHSRRESEDLLQPDGSVRKVSIFRHMGWTPINWQPNTCQERRESRPPLWMRIFE